MPPVTHTLFLVAAVFAQHATLAAVRVRILSLFRGEFVLLMASLFVGAHLLANHPRIRSIASPLTISLGHAIAAILLATTTHVASVCLAVLFLGMAPVALTMFHLFEAPPDPHPTAEATNASLNGAALRVYRTLAALCVLALAGTDVGDSMGGSEALFAGLAVGHALLSLRFYVSPPPPRTTFCEHAPVERNELFEIGDVGEDEEAEENPEYRVDAASEADSRVPEGTSASVREFLAATKEERQEDALSDVMVVQDDALYNNAQRALRDLSATIHHGLMSAGRTAMNLLSHRFPTLATTMTFGGLWVATLSLMRFGVATPDPVAPNLINVGVAALLIGVGGRRATATGVERAWPWLWVVAMGGFFAYLWIPHVGLPYFVALLEAVGYALTCFVPLEWLVTSLFQPSDPFDRWAWLWTWYHCARVGSMLFAVVGAFVPVVAMMGLWTAYEHVRPKGVEERVASPHFPLVRLAV